MELNLNWKKKKKKTRTHQSVSLARVGGWWVWGKRRKTREKSSGGRRVSVFTCPLVLTAAASAAAGAALPSAATSPPLDALDPIVFERVSLEQLKKEKLKKKSGVEFLIQPQGASKYPAVGRKKDEKSNVSLFFLSSSSSVKSVASTRSLLDSDLSPRQRETL